VGVRWDPTDRSFKADPYPTYRALLEKEPLHRSPFGLTVVSRYEDCMTVYRHPSASNDWRKSPDWEPTFEVDAPALSFLFLDPPDHTRLRGLVSRAFTPKRAEQLRPRAQQIVDQVLDRAEANGGAMEVVADLAFPLPVLMICEMLGVPAEEVDEFKEWSAVTARGLDPPFTWPPGLQERYSAAGGRAMAYFRDLIARRRSQPGDDLLSGLLEAEEQGDKLTEAELLRILYLLLVAGHETTVNLIANGVLALARHPDQFERLRSAPSLTRSAVEEVLRFDPPVHIVGRVVLDDIELSCGTVHPSERLVTLPAAANHDERQFNQPETFDIGRPENRHLGFGFGAHTCIGSPLARLEGQVALGTLARRFRAIELEQDPPPYKDNITLRGIATLGVALHS
jgi:cytochrome P450